MTTKIFVNLPVKDLDTSMAFFERVGYRFNPQFTDETAACMVITDDIYAMLLTYPKFKQFTKKRIVDAKDATEVLIALSFDSKAQVREIVKKAIDAGGKEAREAKDHGFMFEHAFEDLDGHIWEVVWMDPAAIEQS